MGKGKDRWLGEMRRQGVLEYLKREGGARVGELSQLFQVSEPTIRQDLQKLQKKGLIERQHGGAVCKSGAAGRDRRQSPDFALSEERKDAIGRRAADLIEDGDIVILDSGSTTIKIAKYLGEKNNLCIITNDANIALMLADKPSNSILLTAGEYKEYNRSFMGEKAASFFRNVRAQKLFLATDGVSFDAGLTYASFGDLHVKKAMVEASAHIYLVADSSKIGKVSYVSLAELNVVDTLIVDANASQSDLEKLERAGVEVIVADFRD